MHCSPRFLFPIYKQTMYKPTFSTRSKIADNSSDGRSSPSFVPRNTHIQTHFFNITSYHAQQHIQKCSSQTKTCRDLQYGRCWTRGRFGAYFSRSERWRLLFKIVKRKRINNYALYNNPQAFCRYLYVKMWDKIKVGLEL